MRKAAKSLTERHNNRAKQCVRGLYRRRQHLSLPGLAVSPGRDVMSQACGQTLPAACVDQAPQQSDICTSFVLRIQQGSVLGVNCLPDISITC